MGADSVEALVDRIINKLALELAKQVGTDKEHVINEFMKVARQPWYRKHLMDRIKEDQKYNMNSSLTEIPCEILLQIESKYYLAYGREYRDIIMKKANKLKHAPVYLDDTECPEILEKLGIKEKGIYLIKKGKVLKKIDLFDLR